MNLNTYGICKEEIPNFHSTTYSETAAELWIDLYGGVFDFLNTGFAGKSDSGDSRWRVGL